jgi:hypothetical protein
MSASLTMNKLQLLKKIDSAWLQLKESYSGLTESQMTHPGVTGEWSIKDILGHVTTWEEEALKYLPMVMQERRPPRYKDLYGGMDSFNAMMTEKKRSLSISEILKQMNSTHQELIAFLNTVPEEMVTSETRFRHRLKLDTYSHYPIHTKAILEWSLGIVKR